MEEGCWLCAQGVYSFCTLTGCGRAHAVLVDVHACRLCGTGAAVCTRAQVSAALTLTHQDARRGHARQRPQRGPLRPDGRLLFGPRGQRHTARGTDKMR